MEGAQNAEASSTVLVHQEQLLNAGGKGYQKK
mgnify:CR=1 FL=1